MNNSEINICSMKTPFYIFDEKGFIDNYLEFEKAMRSFYPKYQLSYSYKTNYTPYICNLVKKMGGFAEVVSDMEYCLAKKLGYHNEQIVFNGPVKGEKLFEHLDNNGITNIDSLSEAKLIADYASRTGKKLSVGIRINLDVGGNFISRFGLVPGSDDLGKTISILKSSSISIVGLHCHISRNRGIEAWKRRAEIMIAAADRYVEGIPQYISLGSGMFADMDDYLRAQFDSVPTYSDYAEAALKPFHDKYGEDGPVLFTEPGTTLVARYLSFVTRVVSIKSVRGRSIATLDGSFENLGEIATLKKLPIRTLRQTCGKKYDSIDLMGYTCLEQDLMFGGYSGELGEGTILLFENVGGYSIVSKPQFIRPNCPMFLMREDGQIAEIMREESFEDVFNKFVFLGGIMNSFCDVTVLSSACASMFMPGFFSCLRENGERIIRLIGVDIVEHPFMGGMIDKYYRVPRYSDKNYIDCLLDICKDEKVDVFFPQISMELPIVLSRINDFKAIGVHVAISDNTSLSIANNKHRLYEYMANQGMTTPRYYHISNKEELIEKAHLLGFPEKPVVVKMTESSGSRGVRIVKKEISLAGSFLNKKPGSFDISLEDMCKTIDDCNPVPDLIVMEYLPGCEYTVDLLADHGKTLYIAGRRNIESQASIAMTSFTEEKKDAYEICERIVSLLNLDGNIGFDFMLDSNDNPVLTDLNPRVTATIILYMHAGLNFPYLRVKQLLGEKLPNVSVRYGVKMKRKYLDLFD